MFRSEIVPCLKMLKLRSEFHCVGKADAPRPARRVLRASSRYSWLRWQLTFIDLDYIHRNHSETNTYLELLEYGVRYPLNLSIQFKHINSTLRRRVR